MVSVLSLRPFELGDEVHAVAIVAAVYHEYGFTWDADEYHADLYDLAAHFSAPHGFWLAEYEGRPIGTGALHVFPEAIPGSGELTSIDDYPRIVGCDCSLERLYVHPDARRLGAGLALFRHIIAEAHARGCRQMEIWSDKRFAQAHQLYQKLGAEVVGDRICRDPDQSPEFGLRLKLR